MYFLYFNHDHADDADRASEDENELFSHENVNAHDWKHCFHVHGYDDYHHADDNECVQFHCAHVYADVYRRSSNKLMLLIK